MSPYSLIGILFEIIILKTSCTFIKAAQIGSEQLKYTVDEQFQVFSWQSYLTNFSLEPIMIFFFMLPIMKEVF